MPLPALCTSRSLRRSLRGSLPGIGALARVRALLLSVALTIAGCAPAPTRDGSSFLSRSPLPAGTRLSEAGYLTIREAPASPFPDDAPPELPVNDFGRLISSPDPAVRAKAWEDANGSPTFQAELQRLRQALSREEPDNFVAIRIVRDPAVAAEVWLQRDVARTLARHTANPLFRPRRGGITPVERDRLQSLWVARLKQEGVINSLSVNSFTGGVELGVAVEEPEFRRVAAERGWELDSSLTLKFPKPRPSAFADPMIARYVRMFPRVSNARGIQLLAGHGGRIVLDDGCFRLVSEETAKPEPLVIFGRDTQLTLDQQGYLSVLGGDGRERYRVGESGSWAGPNGVDDKDPQVRELRRRCGSAPIINVAEPASERLSSVPEATWVSDYARAKSLSYQTAWDQVIACMKREERRLRGLEVRNRCIRQFN